MRDYKYFNELAKQICFKAGGKAFIRQYRQVENTFALVSIATISSKLIQIACKESVVKYGSVSYLLERNRCFSRIVFKY